MTSVGRLIVNIGDSRTYSFDEHGKLKQLTEDHTLVNEMIKHGELTKEQRRHIRKKMY